jgi:hypothetical protein
MQITMDEVANHAPDILLPPDPEFSGRYVQALNGGRTVAKHASVAFVAICRNAMPWLTQTLGLVERTGWWFESFSTFIYENDSNDGTKEVLAAWAAADPGTRSVSLNTHDRPHLSHTIAPVRTRALAEYRAACQEHVRRHAPDVDYVIVFDTDPWGGWSIDGVMTSLDWLHWHHAANPDGEWYGLASYSWAESLPPNVMPIHYDAFAARLNHWTRRDQNWFHLWHPPVGSMPIPFRSAFGQLAIYKTHEYLSGEYSGEDCEHVTFHRSIRSRMGSLFGINPSMRCVSFWTPEESRGG